MLKECPMCNGKGEIGIKDGAVKKINRSYPLGAGIRVNSYSTIIRRQILCQSSINPDLNIYEQLLTTFIKVIKETK